MSTRQAGAQSRIAQAFEGHKALIAYLTVGYPKLETCLELVPRLEEWGVDMVELGIPFSDPLADGSTIQEASFHALQNGITPQKCLETTGKLRRKVSIPLLFMGYYNPILNYGLEAFCHTSEMAGVDGFVVPDLTPDEGAELEAATQRHRLDLIYLLAPNSSDSRIKLVADHSRGFIYLVSLTGVTGARQQLAAGLEDFVVRVRAKTDLPLAIGFGISGPEQAKRAAAVADGVIVGSRLIQLIKEDSSYGKVKEFITRLRQAIG
ncbi:MAG: tryptophan synthase subunit alpha [Chloroflexi bacterium]|nr:tryptophan synthase subunit alpha [Chloroflexota bacterium]